jgi:uncharacterized membrane protein
MNTKSIARVRVATLHQFLVAQIFYPLVLCTMLAFAFFATRIFLSGRIEFRFLIFNLFLAWIPYWLSFAAWRIDVSMRGNGRQRDRALVAVVWLAWLATFPNAPYILTDFVHLHSIPVLTWWFDLGMVATFALAGCFCGIASLRIMHDIVQRNFGPTHGWAFVVAAATLSGFGIYIGRFLRWNSWDILARPHRMFPQLASRMLNPAAHPRTLGVTLMFGAMVLVMYLMFTSLQQRRAGDC